MDYVVEWGEVNSIALARALAMPFERKHPEQYVSVEEVAARLVAEGRLLGRVEHGAWLLRLPQGVAS